MKKRGKNKLFGNSKMLAALIVIAAVLMSGATVTHVYTQIILPEEGSIWPGLNADKIDGLDAEDLLAADVGGGGAAVTCTVICNGACPAAPEGWTLKESTGSSGGSATGGGGNVYSPAAGNYQPISGYGYAAGRCAYIGPTSYSYYGIPQNYALSMGTERMCCYFYTP